MQDYGQWAFERFIRRRQSRSSYDEPRLTPSEGNEKKQWWYVSGASMKRADADEAPAHTKIVKKPPEVFIHRH
jgi:hypothetical protein